MEQISAWLSQAWTSIVHHLTHMTLGMALWMGFLLLTLVLMILMSTRWGGVKPIWKCVILSIFAHVLLGGYAYGTKLIFKTPELPTSETISLKLVDTRNPPSDGEHTGTTRANPWDEFDLAPEVKPSAETIDRLQPEVQQTITRTQPELTPHNAQPRIPTEVSGQLVAQPPTQNEPELTSETQAHQINSSIAQAQQIRIERRQRDESSSFTAPATPDAEDVVRMDGINDDDMKASERSAPQSLANGALQREELLQNLAGATKSSADSRLSQSISQEVQGANQQPDSDSLETNNANNPFQLASAPRRLADGSPMPELYSGRSPENRQKKASANGGTPQTERAVNDALAWLVSTQEADGSWNGVRHGAGREQLVLGHDREGAGSNSDTGLTGLSLLAFLAAGHSHLEGEHKVTVQKGLEYLLGKQAASGEMAGDAKLFARMYCHAMATLAITETLAMTGDQRLKAPVENAVRYSLEAQHPTKGGWRYRPGDDGDMSQFGWQVLVVKSAELGGVEIPTRSKLLMSEFLRSCTSGRHGGLASYRPGTETSIPMTAEALVCRYFLDDEVPATVASEASQYLLQDMPGSRQENLYYWYYGTLAMFQTGGPAWETWNQRLTDTLVNSQIREGDSAGSWDPSGQWAGYGGRVYSTAMAALCLEVYYRYQTE